MSFLAVRMGLGAMGSALVVSVRLSLGYATALFHIYDSCTQRSNGFTYIIKTITKTKHRAHVLGPRRWDHHYG